MVSLICTVWVFIASFGSLVADSFFSTYSVDVIDGHYAERYQEIVLHGNDPVILKRQLHQGTYPITADWFWELEPSSSVHPVQDEHGRLIRLEAPDPHNGTLFPLATFDYSPTSIVVKAHEGTEWIYHLDQGFLQKVTYPGGAAHSYSYDPVSHQIIQKETETGALLTNHYYAMGVNYVGNRVITITDPRDPALGRVKEQGNPAPLAYYFYTEDSTEVVDANGQRTVFSYDPLAKKILSISYYLDGPRPYRVERFTWNSHLIEKTIEDGEGHLVFSEHYDYDQEGHLICQMLQGDLTGTGASNESYSREWIYEKGHLVKEKEDNGTWTLYTYDASSRLKGRVKGKNEAVLQREIFRYNEQGTLTESVIDNGSSCDVEDPTGVTTQQVKKRSHVPSFLPSSPLPFVNLILPLEQEEKRYDRLGRLIHQQGTSYSYDVLDRLVTKTAPSGEREEISYNMRGSPTRIRHADGTEDHLYYNLDGTLKETIDRDGQVVYYSLEGEQACFLSSQLDDHWSEHSFSGVFGQGERYAHCRITFINGINVTETELFQTLHMMSSSHGGANIHYSYMASIGWTKDMLKSFYTKMGCILEEAQSLVKVWNGLLKEDVDIFHYAHSLGGTTTLRAKELLSPADRARIHVVTFGSATIIQDDDFKSTLNIINMRDGVPPLTDPVAYSKALLGKVPQVLFIGSLFDGPPLIDHLFDAYWRNWTGQHWKYFESKLR